MKTTTPTVRRYRSSRPVALLAIITAIAAASLPLFAQRLVPLGGADAVGPAPATSVAATKPEERVAGEPGRAPLDPTEPGNLMERAAASGQTVYVGDSFAAVDDLREAIRMAHDGRAQQAITKFQDVIDKYGDKIVYLNNDSFASVTDYCRTQILKIPAVRDGLYDTLFAGAVELALKTPLAQGDIAEVSRICDRYFCSTAAIKGLNQTAEWRFERGEFAAAARVWQQLLQHPRATNDQRALFLHHASVAEKFAGRADLAGSLVERLAKEFPDATGSVNGKSVDLLASAKAVLAGPALEVTAGIPDEWPQIGGSARRDIVPDVNATAGARLWSVNFEDDGSGTSISAKRPPRAVPVTGGKVADPTPIMASYPILSNGTLVVHTGERIAAISANAGTVLWTYPSQVVPLVSAEMEAQIRSGNIMYRMPFFHAAAVFDNQVYAVLPSSSPPKVGTAPRMNYYPSWFSSNNRIVALNRADGREMWPKPVLASDIDLNDKNGSLTFVGSPVVTRQGVFVMARRIAAENFTQLYLVRIDRATGNVSWCCYLCSAGGAGYGLSPTSGRIPVPTVADDVVYISTGQGADVAVDANAGRIQWLQITENAKTPRGISSGSNNMEQTPSWKFNAPLILGDNLVTFEIGGFLRVYDRWSGKLLFKKDGRDLGRLDVLCGFHGKSLITVGSDANMAIRSINLDTFKDEWYLDNRASSDAGKIQGRPFLAKGLLYIPHERGLRMIDLDKKAEVDFSAWPKNEKDENGKPGNMLVTTEQIVVVSDREIAGYSRWETARDNRMSKIKAAPDNPEPYLALAEIAFRTNHFDLAAENLSKSVALAVDPAARTPEEFRQRLYRTSLTFAEQLLDKKDTTQRALARFYYEQCKLTAYNAETQAEWRLSMSNLALAEEKWAEAVELFNAVLNDSAMRAAPYHKGDTLARAGVCAEQQIKSLVDKLGRKQLAGTPGANDAAQIDAAGREAVYKPYEALAAGQLRKARSENAASRAASLAMVVDCYPNALAAVSAATDLAAVYKANNQLLEAIKTLRWSYPRASGSARAQIVADLALNHAAVNRWTAALSWADRGARSFKDAAITDAGKATSFAALRDGLRAAMPGDIEGRRPTLPLPRGDEKDDHAHLVLDSYPVKGPDADENNKFLFTNGFLMPPVELSAVYRRPDMFFVLNAPVDPTDPEPSPTRKRHLPTRIRMFDVPSLTERAMVPGRNFGGVELPGNVGTLLLGSYGDVSIFVQASQVFALDTKTATVKWKQNLAMPADQRSKILNITQLIKAAQQQEAQRLGIPMIYDQDTGTSYTATQSAMALATDPDLGRKVTFEATLDAGQMQFSNMRMIGNKLVVVAGASMTAYDLATGQPAWKDRPAAALPEGVPSALLGNEDVIVAQVDTERGGSVLRIFETASGKFLGEIKLNEEHAAWRGLSEDGILFVVTDQAVAAYDCFNLSDTKRPLWRRDDIKVKWAAASAITLDGLVLVNTPGVSLTSNELVCLTAEGGEYRWPAVGGWPHLDIPAPAPNGQNVGWSFLRSFVDGDQVIYQTQTGIAAIFSSDGGLSWKSTFNESTFSTEIPPLGFSQLADPYLVTYAVGNQRARGSMLVVHDRRAGNGRICLRAPLNRDSGDSVTNGEENHDPVILRSWQVVDNAIVMDIASMGKVFVFRAPPAAPK
jgi:outer membrane protein assembly factor BamB